MIVGETGGKSKIETELFQIVSNKVFASRQLSGNILVGAKKDVE